MKIGIAQVPMFWEIDENKEMACELIQKYGDLDFIIFPELCLTGFHRNIAKEGYLADIDAALSEVRSTCREVGANVLIGSASLCDGKVYNSYLALNGEGAVVHNWEKVGLTPSEARFFTAGEARDVIQLNNKKISAIICREADDVDWFLSTCESESLDFIAWPSYIGMRDHSTEDSDFFENVATLAARLKTTVVQCNWPQALNVGPTANMCGSVVFGPTGEKLFELPSNQPCFGVVDLSSNMFSLQPIYRKDIVDWVSANEV